MSNTQRERNCEFLPESAPPIALVDSNPRPVMLTLGGLGSVSEHRLRELFERSPGPPFSRETRHALRNRSRWFPNHCGPGNPMLARAAKTAHPWAVQIPLTVNAPGCPSGRPSESLRLSSATRHAVSRQPSKVLQRGPLGCFRPQLSRPRSIHNVRCSAVQSKGIRPPNSEPSAGEHVCGALGRPSFSVDTAFGAMG